MSNDFWTHVEVRGLDECWPWKLSKSPKGYGVASTTNGTKSAARVAYALAYGEAVPPDKEACHSCDNPPCCNPNHIWIGTHTENMRDASNKGRLAGKHAGYHRYYPVRDYCFNGHCIGDWSPWNWYWRGSQKVCRECRRKGPNSTR